MGLVSAVGIAVCRSGRRVGVPIARASFVHPHVECSGMNTDVSVRRCVMGYRLVTDNVMGYRLVTGLYVTNYICLAPELLLTAIPCISWLDAWLNLMKLSLNEIHSQSKQKPGKYPCIVITVSHNYPVLLPEDCFPDHGRGKWLSQQL